ncbi:FliC/FljB family flagellin [Cobetia sp. MB87]|uniref:FliC/FljB family flagellin n=1 Tax=Cobetia sp. MB87 TaxID=2588451 RepID=UPI0014092406|nr:FliC/FljB family flagellin [Cobetia sp. MB87]NHH85087.1 Flagellin [Cobetia sp. MB87]
MASVINTNTLSMVTQQNLNQSQNALNTSMERLSSGMRINSAKDDAAGQAIANRMDSQITGLSQAQRNANDGISVAQTAEGALNQVNDNLQRVRELTVQAQNGTNNTDDLQSIQDEITLRMEEIDRISSQTDFNGVKVLDSNQSLTIQVGANDGETIDIDLKQINSDTLDMAGFNVGGLSGSLSEIKTDDGAGNTTSVEVDLSGVTNGPAGEITLHGYGDYTATDGKYANYAIQDEQGNMYEIAASDVAADGTVTHDFTDAAGLQAAKDNYDTAASTGLTATANPLDTIDAALKQVDSMRSDLGAVQNRFDSAITNLATTETNLASAQSRIQDADYAEEVSSMTTAQILQQAGTSMLTQANQVPQNVLSLLG